VRNSHSLCNEMIHNHWNGWLVVYDTFSVTRPYGVNYRVISERWYFGKNLVGSCLCLILRYYPSIHLVGLRKTTKNLYQD
jgi:hypothetical protein